MVQSYHIHKELHKHLNFCDKFNLKSEGHNFNLRSQGH